MKTAVRWHNVVRLVAGAVLVVSIGAVILIVGVGDAAPAFLLRTVALPWVVLIALSTAAIIATLRKRH